MGGHRDPHPTQGRWCFHAWGCRQAAWWTSVGTTVRRRWGGHELGSGVGEMLAAGGRIPIPTRGCQHFSAGAFMLIANLKSMLNLAGGEPSAFRRPSRPAVFTIGTVRYASQAPTDNPAGLDR